MGFTSNEYKDKWNKEHYDSILLRIPKGKKAVLKRDADFKKMTVNEYINYMLFTKEKPSN